MSDQALGHLKVVELCNLVSGPYCAKLMADLGAEVIKVEAPGTGDDSRRKGPFVNAHPHHELSGLFLYLNTSKLGITLDVSTKTGKAIFTDIVRQADVLIEDNPPDRMRALGLTYDDLEPVNPRLVMTSITPFGQTGPYSGYKAYEMNTCHSSGEAFLLPFQTEETDREPVKSGDIVADSICGLSACLATLSAALLSAATGVGQHIDVSKQDVLMSLVQHHICTNANTGEVSTRIAKGYLLAVPMECQDGHIMVSIVSDREWHSFVECMGNPAWTDDERFESWVGRHLWARTEINPRLREWVRQFTKDELFHKLQAIGVAAVPVTTAEDLAKSPQLWERGFFTKITHPEAGTATYPTAGYQLSETPWRAAGAAPLLGEHNETVYCQRLGFSREELARLAEAGVI